MVILMAKTKTKAAEDNPKQGVITITAWRKGGLSFAVDGNLNHAEVIGLLHAAAAEYSRTLLYPTTEDGD